MQFFFREAVPNEILRVVQELRANLSIFWSDSPDQALAKTVMEELLSQVEEFSGNTNVRPLDLWDILALGLLRIFNKAVPS